MCFVLHAVLCCFKSEPLVFSQCALPLKFFLSQVSLFFRLRMTNPGSVEYPARPPRTALRGS